MHPNSLVRLLAAAETAPLTQPNPTAMKLLPIGWIAIFVAMFYFMVIRPQQKRARVQADLLKALRPGDKVITTGGLIGVVVGLKDKSVSIRSADTKIEILKSAVTEITERAAAAPEA